MPDFHNRNIDNINKMSQDLELQDLSNKWFTKSHKYEYSYHFEWLGLPIIQYPQDIIALQEIIWNYKPSLIIETGIARGGSLLFYASIMQLLGGNRQVLGIDVEIRPNNKTNIKNHPLYKYITMLEGSSINQDVIKDVYRRASHHTKILLCLDSNHSKDHVLTELNSYSSLISKGGYIIVFDTVIHEMKDYSFDGKSWNQNNSPRQAVDTFLSQTDRFTIDKEIDKKLLISAAPNGYLKCIK